MKSTTFFLILAVLLCNCSTSNHEDANSAITSQESNYKKLESFQRIIDSAGVKGSILIYDSEQDIYYSNDFKRSNSGFLPASTFKIPNSIIALETGVVKNDSTLFKWDGEKRALPTWERDMILKEAFHFSCVPCYQEIARNIGVERMQEYVKKLEFGDMRVDSSTIDVFWLQGDSRITPMQELDFFRRFYNSELPVSPRTYQIMKQMMVIEENDDYRLSGKTGWVIRDGFNIGWFVALMEKNGKNYFLVVNIEPKEDFNMEFFAKIRKEIGMKALEEIVGG